MADALNIGQSAYNKLEKGISIPTLEQVITISETIKTPLNKLLPNSNYTNQHNENFSNCTVIGIDTFNITIEKVEELKKHIDDFLTYFNSSKK